MNRTIILINFIITSSLTNPIDEIKTAVDNVRVKIKESTELPNSTEENISRNVNIDDLINNSEMNEMYNFKSRNKYVRHLKEPEVNLAFDITDVNNDKSKSKTGKKEYLIADFQSEVKNIPESKPSSKDRPVSEIESTTAYFDISRTEDYLEGPFEGIESDKKPSEEEFEIVQFEFEAPNSEWDVLDDIISTRRMSNEETKVIEPKAKTMKENDDSSKSAQSESLKGNKTYKSSQKENIDENVASKSVERENTKDDNNKSGNKENPKDDESSERIEEKNIESYENSDSVKKKHSEADDTSRSIGNENVEDETSKSVKNPKAFHRDATTGDLRPNGNMLRSSKPFDNKRIEVIHNQHVPHIHPSLRFEEPRPGPTSYQIRPANPVNLKNVENQGFKSRNIGKLPFASRSQEFDSKQALEKSMEYTENRNIDDYRYERTANAYSYTPERLGSKPDYIFSKLVEASKNSQRNRANFPKPNYGTPFNNFRRFGGISNPNLYMYPPNIRPLSTTFRSAK